LAQLVRRRPPLLLDFGEIYMGTGEGMELRLGNSNLMFMTMEGRRE
jgi:hypothetical protein